MEFALNSMVKLTQNQKCCNFVKNWYLRTKFYQEVHFQDSKSAEMDFTNFLKNFPIFQISRFSMKSGILAIF